MKILYITPSLPNDFSRIRTKNILKSLKNSGHEITLISLYSSQKDLIYLDETNEIVNETILVKQNKLTSMIKCLFGLFLPKPLRVSYVNSNQLHKKLKGMSNDFDFVYIKRLRMSQYAKHFLKEKVYIDITDSLTKYYDRVRKKTRMLKRMLNEEEFIKHKMYEQKIVMNYNTVICSEEDKKYLQKLCGNELKNMTVIDNTIDTKEWLVEAPKISSKTQRRKIVFSGMMDYEPNILATKFFMQEIHPLLPTEYEITFVGKNCSEELKEYESERVKFTGYVEDMREELKKHDIYICPIVAGSGVKNKILQASCVGLPIISSDLGVEGLSEEVRKNIFIANNPSDYINAIKQINNMESEELQKIVDKQQKLIRKKYDLNIGVGNLVKKVMK